MSQLNGNNYFFSIDSVDLSAYTVSITFSRTNSVVDVTAGANTTHEERAAGIDDTSIEVSIGYEVGQAPTLFAKLKAGSIFSMEYGPEGQTAGKPRHVQNFIIEGSPFTQAVKKPHVVFAMSAKGSEAASSDMFAGVTY